MTPNRKRGRNNQEDEVEFMPLSKRINNLHINNGMLMEGCPHPLAPPPEWGSMPPGYPQHHHHHHHQLPETPPNSVQSIDWSQVQQYSPELNEHQNPHYFAANKLLFEMYLQRIQRGYPSS